MRGHIHRRDSKDRAGNAKSLWYVVIDIARGPDGRRRQKWHGSYPSRHAAEAARAEIIYRWYGGGYVEPSKLTLEEWVTDRWLPAMQNRVRSTTWASYRRNFELHLLPRLGRYPMQKLTPGLLDSTYQQLLRTGRQNGSGGGLSPKTVNYLHTTLHTALRDAADAGLLTTNPADRAKPPRPAKTSPDGVRCWTPEQLRKFLMSVSGERLEAAWHLTAMTGMRRGEVLGLRWGDVDLESSRLVVRHTIIGTEHGARESTPKSGRPRMIDLDPGTVAQLRGHLARQAIEQDRRDAECRESDLVFCREDGRHLDPDLFSRTFLGLAAEAGLPRIRLHDLRHTHASIGLNAGVPLKVISERLGHADPEYTMRQYIHALPGMQKEAAAKIASIVLPQS